MKLFEQILTSANTKTDKIEIVQKFRIPEVRFITCIRGMEGGGVIKTKFINKTFATMFKSRKSYEDQHKL